VIATATDTVVTDIGLGFHPTLITVTPYGSAEFASGALSGDGTDIYYIDQTDNTLRTLVLT